MTTLMEWNRELMYNDSFALYSYDWVEDVDGSSYQKLHTTPTLMGVPCYLSIFKNALGSNFRLDRPQTTREDRKPIERVFALFCDREHLIKAGDMLRVNHCGEVFEFIAGEPYKYPCYQEMLVYSILDA